MYRRSSTVAFSVAILILVARQFASAQVESSPDLEAPKVEVTVQKVESLDRELSDLKDLEQFLKFLGDPLKRQDGESATDYLGRVDKILKGRALTVTLIGQRYRSALEAKFRLERELADYERWVEVVAKDLQLDEQNYKAKERELDKEIPGIQRDIIVLSKLIYDELSKTNAKDADERYKAFFEKRIDKVADRQAREQKFIKLTLDMKEKEHGSLLDQLADKKFERDYLRTNAIVEAAAFKDVLPENHRKVIADARRMLESNEVKQIDDAAAHLSIVAGYVLNSLKLVQPNKGPVETAKAVQQLAQIDGGLQQSVQNILLRGMNPTARTSLLEGFGEEPDAAASESNGSAELK
jgi:hypothetical protein